VAPEAKAVEAGENAMAVKARGILFPPVEGDPHPKFNVNRVYLVVCLLPNGDFHHEPERLIMDAGDGGESLLSVLNQSLFELLSVLNKKPKGCARQFCVLRGC
jgi:hypothetical protein